MTAQVTTPVEPLAASRLTLTPAEALPGEPLRASLALVNSGAQAMAVTLSAPLPGGSVLVDGSLWASSGPAPTLDGATVRWAGTLPARSALTLGWSLRAEAPGVVTQTAVVQPTTGSPLALTSQARLSHFRLYLPLIVAHR